MTATSPSGVAVCGRVREAVFVEVDMFERVLEEVDGDDWYVDVEGDVEVDVEGAVDCIVELEELGAR